MIEVKINVTTVGYDYHCAQVVIAVFESFAQHSRHLAYVLFPNLVVSSSPGSSVPKIDNKKKI